MNAVAPLLVFGWGNPGRGDDGLGPLFVEQLAARRGAGSGVELLDDFQLQVEHALDLVGRSRVLFVDASLGCAAPFEATTVSAARGRSVSTHALSPAALLQVYQDLHGEAPPACTLLAIRGQDFGLGAPLSAPACRHLALALDWATSWLAGAPAEAANA